MTLSFAAVKEWYPIAVSGTAVSATNIFLFLGASLGTTVSGWMIGSSYTLGSFRAVWAVMLAACVLAVVSLLLFRERRPEDPLFGSDRSG